LLKVGLTGAIGTGKSTVGKMLAELGAHVIEADSIARGLMQPGQNVYDEVVRTFGREILAADGAIDRRKLADAAFGTPEHPKGRAQELNRLVHPAVGRAQEQWMAARGRSDREAVVVVEAALILEAGLEGQFDRIVVVTCPFETRVGRWMSRHQVDETSAGRELERRMAAQWPEERKLAAGDFVVDNSGTEPETETKVRELYAQLKLEAARVG
jgi:dephospho-CoA kinase